MKKLLTLLLTASLLCFTAGSFAANRTFNLNSPDGNILVSVNASGNDISYSVSFKGEQVLAPSTVAMTLGDGSRYDGSVRFQKAVRESHEGVINTVAYKKARVRERYNSLTLRYKTFDLVFRAYDEGVAYRFVSKAADETIVKDETAQFNFPGDWPMIVSYVRKEADSFEEQFFNSFENYYSRFKLSGWNPKRLAFLPILVEAPGGVKLAITESDLLGYPGMYLASNGSTSLKGVYAPYPSKVEQGGHNMLQGLVKAREDYIAKVPARKAFPWRVMQIASKDTELANSDLVYKLGTPAADTDWSWVKPGKVAWDWWNDWNIGGVDFKAGINTETYKYYIDFASAHGIEYVILDEGWAVNKQADLFQIIPEIDLGEIISYGKSKNVGIILWAGYWAFNRDIERVCRHFSEMGVKGFKVDFMDRDDQPIVEFYEKVASTAAKYKLVVDFHGAFKPAGLQRTWPNVLNFEGVNGLEQLKWAPVETDQVTYDVTIPYIRMMAGSMDYTQGAMRNATRRNYRPVNSEPMSQGTRCRQMAEYAIFDAPLTMLCDSPTMYMAEPECTEFIAAFPTSWDETVAIDGKVAEYIAMARRKGDSWYVGAMTDWNARKLTLDLGFLPAGKYTMTVFRDGRNANRLARDYVKEEKELTISAPSSSVEIEMAPGGGWVALIQPD